jgi:endonuclease/exonuclease/phosphatase family metal-dependent hydrolase
VRPLDGIFVRGDLEVGACRVVRSKLALTASDHRPLFAELTAT